MNNLPLLAARNVRRNRRRTAVTLIAIMIGVALIMLMRGFTYGFVKLMIEDVVKGRTGALQIHRAGAMKNVEAMPTELNMPITPELISRIKSVRGVTGVAGRIRFNGLVSNGTNQTMFVGQGIGVDNERTACPRFGFDVRKGGAALTSNDYAVALIGFELAKSFGFDAADISRSLTVQASSPQGRSNAMDVAVKGLTSSSLPFENKRVMTFPLKTAQDLLGMQGLVTEYAVGIDKLDELERVANDLRKVLGPDFEVHTWKDLQPFVRDVISRQTVLLGSIAVVLFVIAVTGIVNTMLMSVFERVREIGTMLAVGVRRRQILALFVLEAGIIGVIGGTSGALLAQIALFVLETKGISLNLAQNFGGSLLRPSVPPLFALMSVVVAILGALGAAIYPAYRASRLNPVDALRSN